MPNKADYQEKAPKSVVIIGITIVLLIAGWIFGPVPYGIKYIECGKPPTIIDPPGLWSGSSIGMPHEPGDEEYGPGIGKTYSCFRIDETYPDNSPKR